MRRIFKSAIAGGTFLALGAVMVKPALGATFDGQWNVQIASSIAACPSGVSVSIGINNGEVASNSSAMTASGRVAEAGKISVTLANGSQKAVGSGRLTGTSGSGTWSASLCSGTWTAQRI